MAEQKDTLAERQYQDCDGNKASLDTLCRREPAWAANRLRVAQERERKLLDVVEAAKELRKTVDGDTFLQAQNIDRLDCALAALEGDEGRGGR